MNGEHLVLQIPLACAQERVNKSLRSLRHGTITIDDAQSGCTAVDMFYHMIHTRLLFQFKTRREDVFRLPDTSLVTTGEGAEVKFRDQSSGPTDDPFARMRHPSTSLILLPYTYCFHLLPLSLPCPLFVFYRTLRATMRGAARAKSVGIVSAVGIPLERRAGFPPKHARLLSLHD